MHFGTLERLVEDRTTFFKLDAPLMGRSAVKAEDQDRTLAALCRAMSGFESTNGYFAARPSQDPPDLGTEEAPWLRERGQAAPGLWPRVWKVFQSSLEISSASFLSLRLPGQQDLCSLRPAFGL